MKLFHISSALLVTLSSLVCFADDRPIVFDGTFWHTLTKSEKGLFVAGFVEGNGIGFAQGKSAATNALIDIHGVKGARADAAIQVSNNLDPSRYSFGLIADGVDDCYKDFRNRDVEVDMCIAWAVDGIQGDDDKSREAFLESVRQSVTAAKAGAKAKQ
jgi:hypothetical protein